MDAENGFLIDGKVYEVPSLHSLGNDEAQVMYDKCGIVQEDFVQGADETDGEYDERVSKLTRHPGFMASLMQIAYQRGNPDLKPGQVTLVLGKTNRLEALSALASSEGPEEDEVPLVSTSEPNEASASGSLENESSTADSNAISGSVSTNGSDAQGGGVVTIGTGVSVTSSTLAPTTSVA